MARPRYRCKRHGTFHLHIIPPEGAVEVVCPICLRPVETIIPTLPPLKAIRKRCLLCKRYHANAIRLCEYDGKRKPMCPLYPHRFGCRPYSPRYPKLSQAWKRREQELKESDDGQD